jgi:hypothetical protein
MEINPISNTYDSVTYTTFSVLTAPLRIALIDSSAINSYDFVNIWSADISDPNIYGLVDITSTAAVYEEITFSGLPTNTSFKLLIAHDAANGSLGFVEETYTITSKLCQFNLGDVTGAAHNNLTDISWAFFDETSTDALGAPLQSGVDSADANGQLNLSIDDMRASDNGKLVLSQGTNKTAHYDVTLL